ncbi:MAG: glycosyltransferase family 4 protein [Acidobacteria bacterium]|nr:glycosyltransferase family 4 protein [Acidobacteriota bacterium]
MPRLAWFSPMPPVRSGIATYSAEVVAALRDEHDIDVFVHQLGDKLGNGSGSPETAAAGDGSVRSAHDFIWMHRQRPYDLTVFQMGNSSHHDFIWPYLFRYPGLAVLHDAHLHHARAAALLRTNRAAHYRAEFTANDPKVSPDLAELAVAGFDSHLYYRWPMTRLAVDASRVTAVHAGLMASAIRHGSPGATVETIRLGHGTEVSDDQALEARARIRRRHGIPGDAVLFGVVGGLSPDKRLPQILHALAAVRVYAPTARLLLAGAPAHHYDVAGDVARRGLAPFVTMTGYLETDRDVTDHIAACDVSLNLRWPTAREVSGPWLRALGAGRPTITIDLAHMADVPSLDPRTWTVSHTAALTSAAPGPVTVALDIMDEDHSLRLAMRRLATDPELRARLGAGARQYWRREYSPASMLADYRAVIRKAINPPMRRPDPARVARPLHLADSGDALLGKLLAPFAPAADLWSKI